VPGARPPIVPRGRAPPRAGGEPQRLCGRQRKPVCRASLVGLVHRAEHRQRRAAADVGRERHADRRGARLASAIRNSPLPRKLFDVGQCATAAPASCSRCTSSARWTPCRRRCAGRRGRAARTRRGSRARRERAPAPRDLLVRLGEVRLQVRAGVLGDERARGGKLRGVDVARSAASRVGEPAAAVPARDQRLRLVVARLRVSVSAAARCGPSGPCRRRPASARERGREQRVDRARVHGAVDRRRGDPWRRHSSRYASAVAAANAGSAPRCSTTNV